MGADFSSHQVFCGDVEHEASRVSVTNAMAGFLLSSDYVPAQGEEDADRNFVIGPAGRWLHIGDSAGSTDYADPEGFAAVSRAVSFLYPVVDIMMSDSAAIHFYLYRNGAAADKYGNMDFPFFRFTTDEAAREYQGHPDLWADLLLKGNHVNDLRDAWTQWGGWSADTILDKTVALLGWQPELVHVGYTYDMEGVPMKWDEYLEDEEGVDLSAFQESHWQSVVRAPDERGH